MERLEATQNYLENAFTRGALLRQVHFLLGRIASLQGDYSAAQGHYTDLVALDIRNPIVIYNTAQLIRNWLASAAMQDPASELRKIYQAWNTRLPERAETYLLLNLLVSHYQAETNRGRNILQAGVKADAQPIGLLIQAINE